MIQVWINKDETGNVSALAGKLEKLLTDNSMLHASLIALDEKRKEDFEQVVKDQEIQRLDVAVLPAAEKDEAAKAFKLAPEAKNTIHIYKNKVVVQNFVDLSESDFTKVIEAVKDL